MSTIKAISNHHNQVCISFKLSEKIPTTVGQSVQPGDTVVVIEAMKMEIPVVAPEAGTIASIDVQVGDSIEAGAVLATLN